MYKKLPSKFVSSLLSSYQDDCYHFFTQKGYRFILKDSGLLSRIGIVEHDYILQKNQKYLYGQQDYLKYVGNETPYIKNSPLFQEFFLFFFLKHEQYQKDIFKYFNLLNPFPLEESLFPLIKAITTTQKDFLNTLQQLPVSSFGLSATLLPIFINELNAENISQVDQDKFIYQFLKNRKNQLKEPIYAIKVRDQLCDFYQHDKDKLAIYFDFFPALNLLYNDITDLDIFEDTVSLSTCVSLNCRKMITQLALDNWQEQNYKNVSISFAKRMVRSEQLEDVTIDENSSNKGVVHFFFIHDNPAFTKSFFKDSCVQFLMDLKKYNLHYSEVNPTFIDSWIQQYHLNKNLPHSSPVAKPKI